MKRITALIAPYRGLPREIYILFFSRIINSMGTFVFPLLALILSSKIGLSKVDTGNFMTLLVFTQAPSMIIGGKLVDIFGRKKVIMIFQGLGALTFLLCGFVKPSMTLAYMIIAASNLYAIASPAFEAVTADLTNPENRKGSFSLLYMGHNLGFAVGPILGGLLFDNYLNLVFIGDALTTILSLLMFVFFIGETHPDKQEVKIEGHRELEQNFHGSVWSVLFKRPVLVYFAAIMFIYQFAYSQWGFTLPLQMKDLFGANIGSKYYGTIAGFNGFVVIACTPFITKFTGKISSMKVIALGGILYAFAFGMLGFIGSLPLFYISMFIMTLGEIMISINSGAFIANHTPASHRGRVNSVLPLITGAGYTLGPMVMGRVLTVYNITVGWSIVGISVLAGGLLMFALEGWERRKKAGIGESVLENN